MVKILLVKPSFKKDALCCISLVREMTAQVNKKIITPQHFVIFLRFSKQDTPRRSPHSR